jgi:hypothetical protein
MRRGATVKVDPNQAVDLQQEFILCAEGCVACHDGSRTPLADLDGANAFRDFCSSLDPNKCYIVALLTSEADREVYFRARDVARRLGVHMQAPVETPERVREMWEAYVSLKSRPLVAAAGMPQDQPE